MNKKLRMRMSGDISIPLAYDAQIAAMTGDCLEWNRTYYRYIPESERRAEYDEVKHVLMVLLSCRCAIN